MTPGKTELGEYLKERGVDEKFIASVNADERAALISGVTADERVVNVKQGMGTKPSLGQATCFITDDKFDHQSDPRKNPFLSLLDSKPDAHEVIIVMANGWPEYTVWNGKGILVAEVPPNVAHDSTIPAPFKQRLNGAISCLRCHGPSDGYQSFRNEIQDTFRDRGRLIADVSGRADQLANQTRIVSLYTGELGRVVKSARDTFDRRCFAISGAGAKHLCGALGRMVNEYEYEFITPKKAAEQLGFSVPAEDPTGVVTFRRVVPAKSLTGDIADDGLIARLHTDYLDEDSGRRIALTLTPQEWETIYADAMDRALPQVRAVKQEK